MTLWFSIRSRIDRVVAAILLLVTSPLLGCAAWFVRREDGGPMFIRVPRVGRFGVVFGMWKVRSMRADTSDGLASGGSLTQGEDARVTRTGLWLRRLHIDELPQLINVVVGEMTLVGPRPESPDYVDHSDASWGNVLQAAPGILGPTQIVVGDWEQSVISDVAGDERYRSEVVPVKLALDIWYLRTATPFLDLLTVVSLIGHLRERGSAQRLVERVRGEVIEAEPACRYLELAKNSAERC